MKKILSMFALALCVGVVGACNSLPTVQQQFQTGCTIVNGDLAILAASPLLSPTQQSQITTVILPANQAICKGDAALNVTDLKAFHDSLLPAAIAIVQGVPAIPNQPAVLLGLQTFGPMVQALIDQIITATGK